MELKPQMLVECEDRTWRVLSDKGPVFESREHALAAVVDDLPDDAPSPLVINYCAFPERTVGLLHHNF